MIIDLHTQLWDHPDQLGAGTTRRLIAAHGREPWNRPAVTSDALREAAGVGSRVVVHGFSSRLLQTSIANQTVARWVADEPEKRLGFAGVDPLADDWADQVASAGDLGLVGLTISPGAQGYPPTDYRAHALFTQAVKRNLPVMVLPGLQFNPRAVMDFARPRMFDEVGRQFPDLRLVLAAAGDPWIDEALTLLTKHRNFYACLSGLTRRRQLLHQTLVAAQELGIAEQLLFGSDFPFAPPAEAVEAVLTTNAAVRGSHLPAVPREMLEQIVQRDSLACLGIKAAAKITTPRM